MSDHLRVVAVLSSGIGPQGKILMIHMFSMVISEDLSHERKEKGKKSYTSWV